jgi:succinate dehydrogenase / fumarate reductase cytochrome b subunit
MQTFWYKMHFGEMPMHDGLKDLHTVVLAFFSPENSLGIVAVLGYVLAQMALAFHLVHGFQSGFQSLGLRHPKYTPAIEKTGYLFGIGVPLLFAIIPVFLYITQL